jgi:hypothetical protein
MGAVKNHFHDEICATADGYDQTYRGYRIYPACFSPAPQFDWEFHHEDYDGAPDSNDNRCGRGASAADCIDQINDLEDDA